MALVESRLTAIVRSDGDALVMHVGEKPYVVATAGPIELSTQGLNLEAMSGMIMQLLPAELQRALTEFGAVEHELPSTPATQGDRFTVVAARGETMSGSKFDGTAARAKRRPPLCLRPLRPLPHPRHLRHLPHHRHHRHLRPFTPSPLRAMSSGLLSTPPKLSRARPG